MPKSSSGFPVVVDRMTKVAIPTTAMKVAVWREGELDATVSAHNRYGVTAYRGLVGDRSMGSWILGPSHFIARSKEKFRVKCGILIIAGE